jgi:hypothetical protein
VKWYYWLIIAALVAVAIFYYTFRKRQTDFIEQIMNGKKFTADDALQALRVVKNNYGEDLARKIEQLARLETAHFSSQQFQLTGTGGMEAHGSAPYYGWFAPFFIANPQYTPIGTTDMLEGKGLSGQGGNQQITDAKKVFVIMPSVEAWMMFLADYAKRYADSGGIFRWYSTDVAKQQLYAAQLASITPRFTNSLTA